MKVLVCWAQISGYMAACWRALAARDGVNLFVLAKGGGDPKEYADFDNSLMRGIPCHLLPVNAPIDPAWLRDFVVAQKPDVVVLNGWFIKPYTEIPFYPELARTKFILGIDNPYLGTLRQRLGRFVMRRFFSRIDRVFVTGERSFRFARLLGFPESRIRRGVYGVDYESFAPLLERRLALSGRWPRKFIYTGRYVPDKAIDVMMDGYTRYRRIVEDPWPLTCCGRGPYASVIRDTPGATNMGFVQPHELPDILVEHGAFVLASRFDPWPLVIVEACAAGLPVVCTEACGSRVELVRDCFNGMGCATENAADFARALAWIHNNHDRLPEFGANARTLAAPYSAQAWCDRWVACLEELCGAAKPDHVRRPEPLAAVGRS